MSLCRRRYLIRAAIVHGLYRIAIQRQFQIYRSVDRYSQANEAFSQCLYMPDPTWPGY
jgi:hypothetical protein